jgi:plastocyanin
LAHFQKQPFSLILRNQYVGVLSALILIQRIMKKNHSLIAILLFATIALIIYSCSKSPGYTAPGGGSTPTGSAVDSINMSGMRYLPAIDTVHVGVAVKWKNDDGYTHTVTSDDGTTFSSGDVTGGTIYTFTPSVTGTFTYHCFYHQSMGMTGKLIVKP